VTNEPQNREDNSTQKIDMRVNIAWGVLLFATVSSILWRTFNNDGSVIALYTILLVLVGVGQLGLFWWQLHLIRDSLKDAHTAAEAAKESADRTREALAHTRFVASRQLRAYLCIDMLDFSGDAVGGLDFRLSEATLTFVLKNKGETPAYNISVETVIPPFLTGLFGRIHAASFSFWAGVIPPIPIFGRSLL
jgi:hypothetical protein